MIFDDIERYSHEFLYRVYVTESLRLIGSYGGKLKYSYIDIINGKSKEQEKSAEEIVNHVLSNAGITITGGEENS